MNLGLSASGPRRNAGSLQWGFNALGVPVAKSWVITVVLFLITGAMVRGKTAGWVAVTVSSVVSVGWSALAVAGLAPGRLWWGSITHPSGGAEIAGLILSIAFLSIVVISRKAFPSRLSRGSWVKAIGVLLVGWVITVAVTRLLVSLRHDATTAINIRFAGISLAWALGLDDLARLPRELRAIPEIAGVMLSATILLAIAVFLRSARRGMSWSEADELDTRTLLSTYGKADSLGWFATRRDKCHLFSPDRRAVISYGQFGPVLLASGDPIGERGSWNDAIAAFLDLAHRNGWIPSAIGTTEEGALAYHAAGLDALSMGDESIIDVATFSLDTQSRTDLRRAIARARRAGVTATVTRQSDLSGAELAQLAACGREWRRGVERGFSMTSGRVADLSDPANLVVRGWQNGTMTALLIFAPWGRTGVSLDIMRRSHGATNGTMEYMVGALIEHCSRSGIGKVSLNFAFLRSIFADADRIGATPMVRLNSSMLGKLDRFFQIERLYRSNQKYDPQWVPRFLCFERPSTLPHVLLACARAEGYAGRREPPPVTLSDPALATISALDRTPTAIEDVLPRRSDQSACRVRNAERLLASGRFPYPVGVSAPTPLADIASGDYVRTSGRVLSRRDHGGVLFFDLIDATTTVQVLASSETVDLPLLRRVLDSGDQLVVEGRFGASRNGTPSILVEHWQIVAKALRPIPFQGLVDPETRLRQRSLHLLTDSGALTKLRQRSAVVSAVRRFMEGHGFTEVDTPILGSTNGGATARPFRTHINAYNEDLVLRIAPELQLKKLVVAGMGPVFEMARNFRNEGADSSHNPEFTCMEAYQPWGDYTSMRLLTEELVRTAATAVHGRPALPIGAGGELVDISTPWAVISVCEAVSDAVGCPVSLDMPFDDLLALARQHAIPLNPSMGPGAVIEELYGELVESSTVMPTFYIDFPAETSPLTAPHRSKPGVVERWDLVVAGLELGTAYSELTDPIEQRRRLTAQSLKAAAGDPEAMEVDEDFLAALELGMLPTGGVGIGIERLAMLITGSTIRDMLTFPFAKRASQR